MGFRGPRDFWRCSAECKIAIRARKFVLLKPNNSHPTRTEHVLTIYFEARCCCPGAAEFILIYPYLGRSRRLPRYGALITRSVPRLTRAYRLTRILHGGLRACVGDTTRNRLIIPDKSDGSRGSSLQDDTTLPAMFWQASKVTKFHLLSPFFSFLPGSLRFGFAAPTLSRPLESARGERMND